MGGARACYALVVASMVVLGCSDDSDGGDDPGSTGGTGGEVSGGAGGASSSGGAGSGTSGGSSGGGAGGTATAGSTSGGSSGSAGAVDEPILERPKDPGYACAVERDNATLDLNPWGRGVLASWGGVTSLVRVQGDYGSELVWSTLDPSGELGAPHVITDAGTDYLTQLTSAIFGERQTLLWSQALAQSTEGEQYLMVAQVDAEGEVVTEPRRLTEATGRELEAELIATDDGYAALWTESPAEGAQTLRFAELDESGALRGEARELVTSANYVAAASLAAVGDGFLVLYSEYEDGLQTRLLSLDAGGAVRGTPRTLATGAFTAGRLLPRGDRALAAWAYVEGDFEAQSAEGTLRVGWFDADAQPIGRVAPLEAPIGDEESVDPQWLDMGEDVGLAWSHGSIIYICAGCMPDNVVRFVVLDGETLAPRSDVTTLTNPQPQGGLLAPTLVRDGDDILIASSITYHVSAEGASGALRCTAESSKSRTTPRK